MNKIRNFEELITWQRARELTRIIYRITLRESFANDFGLSRQIQRATVSVMSNIAEGFERNSFKEFLHFLSIAKASCAELRSELYVALDIGYLTREEFQNIFLKAEEVARLIGGLRSSIKKRRLSS